MDQALLKTYARFAVRNAINVQKGQTLIINCPIEGAFFARMCAQEAYAAGAKDVVVHYADERLSRIRMEGAEKAVLEDIKPWMVDRYMEYAQNPLDVCRLAIYAEDPEIYKGLDTQKVDAANRAYSAALQPWRILSMANRMQWCVLSIPTEAWAVKVFPDKSPADAVESLWQAIFATSRMDAADPAAAWEAHIKTTAKRVDQLNAWRL
ncbi:aminopeptidase, partial [Ruminococcaceae bacterium OttesenSCG-928-O06]|nr:aminopeptidase [Ruminococcaceae bacterium OttesenSCG-928-O06]